MSPAFYPDRLLLWITRRLFIFHQVSLSSVKDKSSLYSTVSIAREWSTQISYKQPLCTFVVSTGICISAQTLSLQNYTTHHPVVRKFLHHVRKSHLSYYLPGYRAAPGNQVSVAAAKETTLQRGLAWYRALGRDVCAYLHTVELFFRQDEFTHTHHNKLSSAELRQSSFRFIRSRNSCIHFFILGTLA
jgi:hypothetical protein